MSGRRDEFLAKSFQYMQDSIRRAGPAVSAGYTLVGAILLLGGVGYLIGWWWFNSPSWFLVGGLMLGIVIGFYELAKAVFR